MFNNELILYTKRRCYRCVKSGTTNIGSLFGDAKPDIEWLSLVTQKEIFLKKKFRTEGRTTGMTNGAETIYPLFLEAGA